MFSQYPSGACVEFPETVVGYVACHRHDHNWEVGSGYIDPDAVFDEQATTITALILGLPLGQPLLWFRAGVMYGLRIEGMETAVAQVWQPRGNTSAWWIGKVDGFGYLDAYPTLREIQEAAQAAYDESQGASVNPLAGR